MRYLIAIIILSIFIQNLVHSVEKKSKPRARRQLGNFLQNYNPFASENNETTENTKITPTLMTVSTVSTTTVSGIHTTVSTEPKENQPKKTTPMKPTEELSTKSSVKTTTIKFTTKTQNENTNLTQSSKTEEKTDVEEKGCPTRNLFPELSSFFNNSLRSDFEFVLADKKVMKAHQFVLAAKSSEFAKIFDETYSTQIEINDEDSGGFVDFLRFFYTEQFVIQANSDLKNIQKVYSLAKQYKFERLMEAIDENLSKYLDLNNLGEVFEFAFYEKLNKSVDEWRDYVRRNSDKIFLNKLYLQKKFHTMESIIYSMNLNETQKLIAIKDIRGLNRSDFDLTRFKRLVNIPDCNGKELSEVNEMHLFDQKEFLDQVMDKFLTLCHKEQELRRLKHAFDVLMKEKETLYRNNLDLERRCEKQYSGRNQPINPKPYEIPVNSNWNPQKPKPINIDFFG